jgi:hypothetical protein
VGDYQNGFRDGRSVIDNIFVLKIINEVIKSLYKNTSVHIDAGRKILDKIYINQGVRQGCNLSPTLFNLYIDDLLRNWKHKVDTGVMLKRNLYLNALLFADDQAIIQD